MHVPHTTFLVCLTKYVLCFLVMLSAACYYDDDEASSSSLQHFEDQRSSSPASQLVRKRKRVFDSFIQDSTFYGPKKPSYVPFRGHDFPYDPLLLPVLSVVRSASPHYQKTGVFKKITLPKSELFKEQSNCPLPFEAYIREASDSDAFTFLLLPGTYTQWKTGVFYNQTLAWIDRQHPGARVLAFNGFLSDPFLRSCVELPWNMNVFAHDLRMRLENVYAEWKVDKERSGVIGYSGGGNMALRLLGIDSQKPSRSRLFAGGGFVGSPVIHHSESFRVLDAIASTVPHRLSFSSADYSFDFIFKTLPYLFTRGFQVTTKRLLDYYKHDPKNVNDRLINQIAYVELLNMMNALSIPNIRHPKRPTYNEVFIHYGLRHLPIANASYEEKLAYYETINDMTQSILHIHHNTVMYFSLDDPFLIDNRKEASSEVMRVLDIAASNPHIMVYTPRWGSHLGVFIDEVFDDLLTFSFTHSASLPTN